MNSGKSRVVVSLQDRRVIIPSRSALHTCRASAGDVLCPASCGNSDIDGVNIPPALESPDSNERKNEGDNSHYLVSSAWKSGQSRVKSLWISPASVFIRATRAMPSLPG